MTPFRLRRPGPFAAYLTTQASWFFAFGLQTTLFPFVARNLLGGDEAQVGLAQTSLTAPALLLVLLAGVVAEHLSKQAGIISVLYPGADNHPQRALAGPHDYHRRRAGPGRPASRPRQIGRASCRERV